jgi:thiamine-monophosphate kinase
MTGAMDEFELIDAIRRLAQGGVRGSRSLAVGIGDDAAVFKSEGATVLTTDTLVEGVHFERGWLSPGALGRRAFRAAASDIAAMGADPRWVFLSLSLPKDYFGANAIALVRGLVGDANATGTVLAGGNVAAGRDLTLTVTVVGVARREPLTRDRAQAGDSVFVTGSPGLARSGLEALLEGKTRGRAIEAWRTPPLRTAVGRRLASLSGIGAVIDVSDGLAQDLNHIARASKVRIRVDRAALPVPSAILRLSGSRGEAESMVLGGGEDYELAFTVRPGRDAAVRRLFTRLGVPVARIGSVENGPPSVVSTHDEDLGRTIPGHDHGRRPGRA